MSVLSRPGILDAISKGTVRISPWNEKSVGPASLSLHLGRSAFYIGMTESTTVDIPQTYPNLEPIEPDTEGYILLQKGRVLLAATEEKISLEKNVGGWLTGTSDLARLGVQVVLSDYVAPGFGLSKPGVLALELVSHVVLNVRLRPGMRIAHLVLMALGCATDIGYDDLSDGYSGASGILSSRLHKRIT